MNVQDDIRRTLRHRAADATISPDAWAEVERRIASGATPTARPGRARPDFRKRPVALLAAAAAVLALVVAAAVLLAGDDDVQRVKTGPGSTRPTTSTPPSTTRIAPTTQSPTPPTKLPGNGLRGSSKVTMEGIGPVRAGMTLREASQATGLTFTADPNSFIDPALKGCGYAKVEGGPAGVDFMLDTDRITRVDISNRDVTTVSGIGVGSTEAEVLATYRGHVTVEPHQYVPGGHYLVYEAPGDSTHLLLFETDGSKVTSFRSGLAAQVRGPEGCA